MGNQQPYVIMCPPYIQFHFWYNISITLDSLCKKILSINQTVLKIQFCGLNTDVNKNQNLELLQDVTYFSNFLAIESLTPGFMSYRKPWNANRIRFGQWWRRCHHNTYSNHITVLIVLKIYQWYWFLQHLLVNTSAKRSFLSAQTKVEISGTPKKLWEILILICVHVQHVQSHNFKTAWWIHRVSLHTAQGTRKHIKSKINS